MEIEGPQSNKIQRLPETLFLNLSKFDGCFVRDRYGKPLSIKEIRKDYTCIFIFIRHFLDYSTKEYVEDFAKIFPSNLEKHNIKLIVVGCAPSRFIQPFCEETNFSHEMYCDSKRIIFQLLDFNNHPESAIVGDAKSPHVKSNFISGFFLTVWRYAKSTVEQGDPLQQGGQLILSPDGEVLYFHRDCQPLDHTPLNDLLRVVGLPRIDFQLSYIGIFDAISVQSLVRKIKQ